MTDTVIDVADLAEELAGDDPPTLLDVRWTLGGVPPGAETYRAGHLTGAVFTDLDTDLSGPPGAGGRHPLPTADAFTAAMRRLGVSHGRPVVVYDAGDGQAAARAWWCLTYFGHVDVRVLDGGYGAWLAAGLPVTTAEPTPEPGDLTADAGHLPLLDADGAAALARTGVLLDARAPERYRGEVEPIDPVAGHIPGAVSAPTSANSRGDGGFLEPSVLREHYAGLGVHETTAVGAYCGSGVSAAHAVLALHLAGHDAALYVGSWSDWVSDDTRPVATGPEAG